MRISDCGIEEVVSGQSSVVSSVFSGDPQGSAGNCGLQISDCGMGSGSRITSHESRESSVAEQSHLSASPRPAGGLRQWFEGDEGVVVEREGVRGIGGGLIMATLVSELAATRVRSGKRTATRFSRNSSLYAKL